MMWHSHEEHDGRGQSPATSTRPGPGSGRPRGKMRGPGPRGGRGRHGSRDEGFGGRGFGPMGGPMGPMGPMGPAFGPMGGPMGRRGRGRRGDVRNAILAILAEGPANGYQIIAKISDKTDGVWRPSAGSVYPALGLLDDEGLIEKVSADGQKAFQLTDAGTAYVTEHADELADPWTKVAGTPDEDLDPRRDLAPLAMAMQQVVMVGTSAQKTAARGVLDEARRQLYRILADEVPAQRSAEGHPAEPTDSPAGAPGSE